MVPRFKVGVVLDPLLPITTSSGSLSVPEKPWCMSQNWVSSFVQKYLRVHRKKQLKPVLSDMCTSIIDLQNSFTCVETQCESQNSDYIKGNLPFKFRMFGNPSFSLKFESNSMNFI